MPLEIVREAATRIRRRGGFPPCSGDLYRECEKLSQVVDSAARLMSLGRPVACDALPLPIHRLAERRAGKLIAIEGGTRR